MDIDELRTTASLAMVELHDEEVERLSQAVTTMLDYFAVMQQVDVSGLEPTTYALSGANPGRNDIVNSNPVNPANLVKRAADNDNNHIVIPNVL